MVTQLSGKTLISHPIFCTLSPATANFTVFCNIFELLGVSQTLGAQAYPKIGVFTAPCGTHETSIFKLSIKSYIGSMQCGPAETSRTLLKSLVCILLFSKKSRKFEVFKIPVFKFKIQVYVIKLKQMVAFQAILMLARRRQAWFIGAISPLDCRDCLIFTIHFEFFKASCLYNQALATLNFDPLCRHCCPLQHPS